MAKEQGVMHHSLPAGIPGVAAAPKVRKVKKQPELHDLSLRSLPASLGLDIYIYKYICVYM